MSQPRPAPSESGPAPRPGSLLPFLVVWFGALALFTAAALGGLWLFGLECHGYESGLACQAHDAMLAIGALALALAPAGVWVARWASPRGRLVATALLVALAIGCVGACLRLVGPAGDAAGSTKRLEHF